VPRPTRLLTCALITATIAAGCAQEADDDPLSGGGWFDLDDEPAEELEDPVAPDTGLGSSEAPEAGDVVEAALRDLDAYWGRTYEDLYGTIWEPIRGGFWPYGPGSASPPCGRPRPPYEEIAGNAFYCPTDDLIAWDEVNLVPGLYDEFGGFTLGIVFAHEMAHAVQARAGVLGSGDTIMTELQADCFAGAWTADVEEGSADHFEVTLRDLDRAVAGFLELRDGVGTAAQDPLAHGTGFDRIGAFSEGYEQGPVRCAQYPDLYESGDYAVTTELARQYAYAAQVRLGDESTGLEADLQADCYAGVYASSGFLANRGEGQLILSPGDLDEAVIAFLLASDSSSDVEGGDVSVATAFQRFDAYRSGFVEGTSACESPG